MDGRSTAVATALLFATMTAIPHHVAAATSGCDQGPQRTEAEGGAGGNWQPTPGTGAAQRTEAEGGAGGNWQPTPGTGAAQRTEAEGGAGGNWQPTPGTGAAQRAEANAAPGANRPTAQGDTTRMASAEPCK
jgi:hypothetical protein